MLFDEQFVTELEKRWARRAKSDRPPLWFVATAPQRAAQRAWMADAFEKLPDPGRSLMLTRLQSEEGFVTACHELALAAILQRCGLDPEYEV